ncbi:(S)-benzoin forming benzil reductase [Halalkalibacter urbisdiaboli]|uniref:(S)-benzoin forming benzil reductase n=1 Tax=Halalkalibacter urbisdiaboli TaxID=1960589 RepID=UPI000B433115|nr:(S)-benzoin forming benzil reductase [Halalkalibacter urbisdiaboli]
MKFFIITGASKGIGEAMARKLLKKDHSIFSISRTCNKALMQLAKDTQASFYDYSFDLTNLHKIDSLFDEMFEIICKDPAIESIYFINNAGILAPVAPIEATQTKDIVKNVHTNLLAPIVCTSAFIRRTNDLRLDKRIMNISSGTAKHLLPSMSCYGTSKAGLDAFTKSVALEQATNVFPIKVVSVYPGMIDTEMQAEIRDTKKVDFPYVDLFKELSSEGKLQSADFTAERLLDLLMSDTFGKEVVVENLIPAL